ncbi:hypothetical protein [Nonomuraea rubra]|uniref:Nuclear transport factor 2 family protein n=1 Tax=Nonomuraea rubra TaxID=46180 RepID=A0A7X0U0L6_9ACTN|nr:hypothetical protein [Nonomuraea rubra]MBB6550862.1 hypothetical protein [Nonomuraea rubra]
MRTLLVTVTSALALPLGLGLAPASAEAGPERRTEDRTRALLAAFERRDVKAISASIDENATFTIPLSFSGASEPAGHFAGKEQILGYVDSVLTHGRTAAWCTPTSTPTRSPSARSSRALAADQDG